MYRDDAKKTWRPYIMHTLLIRKNIPYGQVLLSVAIDYQFDIIIGIRNNIAFLGCCVVWFGAIC